MVLLITISRMFHRTAPFKSILNINSKYNKKSLSNIRINNLASSQPIPEQYKHLAIEQKWQLFWEENEVFKTKDEKDNIFRFACSKWYRFLGWS